MSEQDIETQLHGLMKTWADKSDSKDFHAALMYAVTGYLLSRTENNERLTLGFLGSIRSACDDVLEPLIETAKAEKKNDPLTCSFCSAKASGANDMVAGPYAFICRSCVKMSYEEIFKEHK